jgi:TPR repeat protein
VARLISVGLAIVLVGCQPRQEPFELPANVQLRRGAFAALWLTTSHDENRALQLFDQAARNGDVLAELHIVTYQAQYLKDRHPASAPHVRDELVPKVRAFARRRIPAAQLALADYLYNCRDDAKAEAQEQMQAAAEGGEVEAMALLGSMYQNGYTGAPDLSAAQRWYERAAEAGHPGSMYRTAWCLAQRSGGQYRPASAFEWYRRAAAADYLYGASSVAWCYEHGVGTQRNYKLAVEWLNKGIAAGDPTALAELAHCHIHGAGVPQDLQRARQLLVEARKQGDSDAQEMLDYVERIVAGTEPLPGPIEDCEP